MLRLALVVICLISTPIIAAPITIYGLEKGSRLISKNKNAHYIPQIGAFKNKKNALESQKKFIDKTSKPFQILVPKEKNGIYTVVFGPTRDVRLINLLCKNLLNPPSTGNATNLVQAYTKPKRISSLQISVKEKPPVLLNKKPEHEKVMVQNRDNKFSKMGHTRKIERDEDKIRSELEATARKLYFASAALDKQIKRANSEQEILALKNKQAHINKKLEQIVNMVTARISQTG